MHVAPRFVVLLHAANTKCPQTARGQRPALCPAHGGVWSSKGCPGAVRGGQALLRGQDVRGAGL